MDRITLFQTYVAVAENGSFSKAGEYLELTQSQVSKMIKTLEAEFGVLLIQRTTRQSTLTEEGKLLLTHVKAILDRLELAQDSLKGERSEPKGKLRVLTSDGTGRTIFLDALVQFIERYPQIQVEHVMSDRFMALAEHQLDVALWLGELKDSRYKAKHVGQARRITVASPDYLTKKGIPKTPEDLYHHDCIVFERIANFTGIGSRPTWRYESQETGLFYDIQVKGRYTTDNTSIVRTAAIKGLGVYQGPSYLFDEDLEEGRLIEILKDYRFAPFPMKLIYPEQDYMPNRLKVFIDFFSVMLAT
jgi:LysR family transcriptional regulator, regulator for bpeEF and oprC